MTRTMMAKAAVAVSLTLAFGLATADTQSVLVSATVTAVCKFNSGQSPTMTFTTIDPSGNSNSTGSASVLYRCTKGTSATIVADGTSRTLTGASDTIPYQLVLTPGGAGTGFGSTQDLTLGLAGTITPVNYQNKTAGSYADTIMLTLTP